MYPQGGRRFLQRAGVSAPAGLCWQRLLGLGFVRVVCVGRFAAVLALLERCLFVFVLRWRCFLRCLLRLRGLRSLRGVARMARFACVACAARFACVALLRWRCLRRLVGDFLTTGDLLATTGR